MGRIIHFLQVLFFWGTFFLVILMFGFNITLGALVEDMLNEGMPINIYAGYLLLALPLFLILTILRIVYSCKQEISFFDTVAMSFPSLVWTPYKGITGLSGVVRFGKMTAWEIGYDLKVMFFNLLQTVIWWGTLIFAFYSALKEPQCALKSAITRM